MSRAQRRATRTSARSRRVPAKAARGRGLQLPWIPIAVVAGIVVVVAGVVYLIWQSGQPGDGDNFDAARAAEANASTDLPGEWVDLPKIYGGAYGSDAPNTNTHVESDVDYSEVGLPPVGGSHWGKTNCERTPDDSSAYCGPVPWGVYEPEDVWNAESLVHNMEHAGIVVWYNTEDQAIIDEVLDFGLDNDDRYLVVAPYPDMEENTIAITGWSRRDKFPASEFDRDRLKRFLDAHECRFDPEGLC